jgi:hypothetical protein
VRDPQHRNGGQTGKPGGFDSAMTNQDDVVFIDDDDAVEAEFGDGGRDLVQLLVGMSAGVLRLASNP